MVLGLQRRRLIVLVRRTRVVPIGVRVATERRIPSSHGGRYVRVRHLRSIGQAMSRTRTSGLDERGRGKLLITGRVSRSGPMVRRVSVGGT